MQSAKRIIVTGDITIDWIPARLHRSKGNIQRWGFDNCTRATSQAGYDLPWDEQEQNRDIVRHIHSKLTASRYIIIPARSNEPTFEFPRTFLEALSIMEHERWMNMKLAAGWKPAAKTVKNNKLHNDLVPLEKLSDIAKDKDRDFVRVIPNILDNAGYTVVELRPMKADS